MDSAVSGWQHTDTTESAGRVDSAGSADSTETEYELYSSVLRLAGIGVGIGEFGAI